MGSISSDEGQDEHSGRLGSYSLSADVSESESLSSFSDRRQTPNYEPSHAGDEAASSSHATSPLEWPLTRSEASGCGFPASAALSLIGGRDIVVWEEKKEKHETDLSEVEMMKQRFAKLLLGEDMSGGGKGVCTALAISNAITNLSATVFGELWRLEPLPPQKKSMWHREMEWLLSFSDSIVELIPSLQEFSGGGTVEVMITRPRSDLSVNLPALKKLNAMLIGMLEGFQDTEFWYVEHGILLADVDDSRPSFQRPSQSLEDKWWLPCPGIPSNGLSSDMRKRLQHSRECVNQILKAAMTINSNVLAEMETPDVYFETLPKSGKSCVGDIIYRYIKADQFSPDCLLDCLDLSSEHHILEIVNRLEASIHVWRLKNRKKHSHRTKPRRNPWGGKVKGLVADTEKRELLAQRAESLLRTLRHQYPGLSQTVLDMTKIQYNKDVGQSILESYSRVMESLSFNIMARIDDVIYVDDARKKFAAPESVSMRNRCGIDGFPIQKRISPSPFSVQNTPYASPFATPSYCSPPPLLASPRRRGQSFS